MGMSRPSVFPPSPDYSGGDAGDASPGSPLKKTKHSKNLKRGRVDTISNNLMSLISMNKALKRYHRERAATNTGLGKAVEEKELWRSLRMKKNERGEIVLFL